MLKNTDFLYLIFALAFSVIFLGWAASRERIPKIERYGEGVYYTGFGGIYCGSMEVTPCGITLKKCIDERVYLCMHDLATKEEYIKEEK